MQQSPGNAIIYTQKVITHHFIHCTEIICDPNHTYINAVFGEYCEHHFCKLHRLCETRSLTDELFCELCEKFFIQDRLLGGTDKTGGSVTVSIMTNRSCSSFPRINIWITFESSKLWIIDSTVSLHAIFNVIL